MSVVPRIGLGVATAILVIGTAVMAAQNPSEEVYEPGRNGISSPVPVKKVKPHHPQAAQDAGIESVVRLRIIMRADGTVGDVSVEKSLDKDHGVDDAAIAAAKQWMFEPARRTKDNQPVAVRATIEMAFTLK